jgi:hypothetical protein
VREQREQNSSTYFERVLLRSSLLKVETKTILRR